MLTNHNIRIGASSGDSEPRVNALSNDQVVHWAEMIADGRDAFPKDLAAVDRKRLETAVRARLRDRLIQLIARAVTADLTDRRRPGTENNQ